MPKISEEQYAVLRKYIRKLSTKYITNIAKNAVTTTKKATNKATKTSDTSNVFIWIMGCVAGAGLLTASRKKSKKDQTLK